MPHDLKQGTELVTICPSVPFTTSITSATLNGAIARFEKFLAKVPTACEGCTNNSLAPVLCKGSITVTDPSEDLNLGTDESYTMDISSSSIDIKAGTVYGAMYALTTLGQLVYQSRGMQAGLSIKNTPWSMTDGPAYPHRGVMLDSARNFLPISVLEGVVEFMSTVKLNTFHWHIIDATSFPFVSTSHPELSAKGAYDPASVYSPAMIKAFVGYAKTFGVRVVPEFDTPGHTFVIGNSHPELMICNDIKSQVPANCPEPPCGYLDATNPDATKLIENVISDGMDAFSDLHLHLGGDEVSTFCYGSNAQTLFSGWIDHFVKMVQGAGRTPIVWSSDMGVECDWGQTTSTVVMQVWDNAAFKLKALQKGFKVIDSTYTSYYLDCGFSSWLTGGDSWCPYVSWRQVYNHSLFDASFPEQFRQDIYGGEVPLWGEQVDEGNVMSRLVARAVAVSERLWMDKALLSDQQTAETFLRLSLQRDLLREVYPQWNSAPLVPRYCINHPDMCEAYRAAIGDNKGQYNHV
jgi:hexosaminidase